MPDLREAIATSVRQLSKGKLRETATGLLDTLGYASDRTIRLNSSKPAAFLEFVQSNATETSFNSIKAQTEQWKTADLLFQLTDQELSSQRALFDDREINPGLLRSYLFFAIELTGDNYARGKLTDIARQINRVFPMPVMVLIKHRLNKQPVVSIAVINRRQNKADAAKDVLGKVTIVRDISIEQPHRGHLDILNSIALENLEHPQRLAIDSFDNLHVAWEEIFNVELLNKRFYRELANWYFWAKPQVKFPDDVESDDEKRNATALIRLLTRLIFCWFLKEKGLIPEKLFNETDLKEILTELKPNSSSYYQTILQNLFFGTLNQKMGANPKTKKSWRQFAKDEGFPKNKKNYGVDNLFRYEDQFVDGEDAIEHFADIPFLNGGLFECLDRTADKTKKKIYIDGFARNKKKRPTLSNELFFTDWQTVDLSDSDAYGERSRRSEKVRGLIRILNSYKFTIVENTPIDQEIALDPELLGKVFENLLASYNEETRTTARKQTGSFYTPRSIVDYMVDESLKAHLLTALVKAEVNTVEAKAGLENLFAYTENPHPFNNRQVDTLLDAIHTCKILDPACGSGAFPMGMLQKLVFIIHKLDPENKKWMQLQIDKASEIPNASSRDAAIKAIEQDFKDNEDDYGRKLYLIENCLYGVDIQPIAIQISKLRFFISLVCDQKTNRRKKDNHGIRPLPNLETKFVAADTLISLQKDEQLELYESAKVRRLESELQRVRHDHFSTLTRQKKLSLQARDREIRDELAAELEHAAFWDQTTARKLADWDPYDPQASADYFEPLWMFDRSLGEGFDIVIGNPPYVQIQKFPAKQKAIWVDQKYDTYAATADIYCLFYERAVQLLRPKGQLCYITSNKWMRAGYGSKLRGFLSNKVDTQAVLDFGMAQNFGAATTYTCVVRIANTTSASNTRSCYAVDDKAAMNDPASYFAENQVEQTELDENPWVVLSKDRQRIKKLVEAQGVPLEDWDVSINYGIKTGFNEAFYISQEQRDEFIADDPECSTFIVPLIRGRNIERYRFRSDNEWLINTHNGVREQGLERVDVSKKHPSVLAHLNKYRDKLKKRQDQGDSWTNLRSCAYLSDFSKPKIVYQEIATTLPFVFDFKHNVFTDTTCFMMSSMSEPLGYLTALLNSSVFRCCFKDDFPEYSGNAYRMKKMFIQRISIRRPNGPEEGCLGVLVVLVQFAKNSSHVSGQFLEDLIDACVMECYFREHMAERNLLFLDDLAPHLESFEPDATDAEQSKFLDDLYRILNAPDSPVRNRLLRLTADSPDLLAIIKQEGQV